MKHLGLIHSIIKRTVANLGVKISPELYEDLVQEGVIGLLIGEKRYKPDLGKFSTYVGLWIQSYVITYLEKYGEIIRIPFHIREKQTKFKVLKGKIGEKEALQQLSKENKKNEEEMRKILESKVEKVGLEEDYGDFSPSFLQTLNLKLLIETLPPNEKKVILLNFFEGKTLREISKEMRISAERVRQIKNQALKRLKERSEEDEKM